MTDKYEKLRDLIIYGSEFLDRTDDIIITKLKSMESTLVVDEWSDFISLDEDIITFNIVELAEYVKEQAKEWDRKSIKDIGNMYLLYRILNHGRKELSIFHNINMDYLPDDVKYNGILAMDLDGNCLTADYHSDIPRDIHIDMIRLKNYHIELEELREVVLEKFVIQHGYNGLLTALSPDERQRYKELIKLTNNKSEKELNKFLHGLEDVTSVTHAYNHFEVRYHCDEHEFKELTKKLDEHGCKYECGTGEYKRDYLIRVYFKRDDEE